MSKYCDRSTTNNYYTNNFVPEKWDELLKICIDDKLISTKDIIKKLKKIGLSAILKKKSKKQKRTVLPTKDANEHHREITKNIDKVEFMSVEHETHDRWFWTKIKTLVYYRECLKQEKEKVEYLTKEIKELKNTINNLLSE